MKTYTIVLAAGVYDDLSQIWNYFRDELSSPETAEELFDAFESAILSLRTLPARYPRAESKSTRKIVLRRMIVKNFFIYYYVDETRASVNIVAIIYTRRDQIPRLNEIFDGRMTN